MLSRVSLIVDHVPSATVYFVLSRCHYVDFDCCRRDATVCDVQRRALSTSRHSREATEIRWSIVDRSK